MEKKKSRFSRYSAGDKAFLITGYVLLGLFVLAIIIPMIYIVIASFMDPITLQNKGIVFELEKWTLTAYERVMSNKQIWVGFKNAVIYSLLFTFLSVMITMLCAYPMSRPDFKGRGFFNTLFMITMFFGGGLIPTFIILNNTFNMVDTFLVMVLPFSVISYYIVVARTFFQTSLPGELWDAAQIDGCGNLRYFFRIVLPLSKAILAVIALWAAVGHWNSYFNAMIYLRTPERFPLQLVMRNILINNEMAASAMTGSAAADINRKANLIKYGAIVVSSLPIMNMYPFVQKYFNQGVMLGALKG